MSSRIVLPAGPAGLAMPKPNEMVRQVEITPENWETIYNRLRNPKSNTPLWVRAHLSVLIGESHQGQRQREEIAYWASILAQLMRCRVIDAKQLVK